MRRKRLYFSVIHTKIVFSLSAVEGKLIIVLLSLNGDVYGEGVVYS